MGFAAAESGEHAQGDELALCMGKAGAGVDVPEGVSDNVVGQGWVDVGESVDDTLPAFAVDGGQDLRAAVEASLLADGAEQVLLADVLTVGVGGLG